MNAGPRLTGYELSLEEISRPTRATEPAARRETREVQGDYTPLDGLPGKGDHAPWD